MKKIITFLLLFVVAYTANGQLTFQKSYGGSENELRCYVIQTADGGYALVGTSASFGAGDYDIYLVRTDNQGSILWTKTYGGLFTDVAYDIRQTTDGGFIIAGGTGSFNINTNTTYQDAYLIKTDMNGDTLWTRTYGQEGTDELGWIVQQTYDGGYIVGGSCASSSNGYLIRTNSHGDTLWTKTNNGGVAVSLVQTPNRGFLVGGTVYSNRSSGDDMFLYQTDSLGKVQWYHTYGGSGTDYGEDEKKANDGGFIAMGYTESFGAGSYDMYVVKTDSIGQLEWSRAYGSARYEEGLRLIALKDGSGYALLGRSTVNSSNFYTELLSIDNYGNINWVKDYGTDISTVSSLQQTDDSGFIFTAFNQDWFLTKTDKLGNSGCNDSTDHSFILSAAATDVGNFNPSPLIGTVVRSTPTRIGSGGTATTICLSTGVENVQALPSALSVYPNPCVSCEIKGVENPNDIVVMDIMGRNIPVTLVKSAGGFTMHWEGKNNGIYIVRNIKTGEVSKVIK